MRTSIYHLTVDHRRPNEPVAHGVARALDRAYPLAGAETVPSDMARLASLLDARRTPAPVPVR